MGIKSKKKVLVVSIMFAVCFCFAGFLYAQDNSQATTKHSWHVGGVFNSYYHFGHNDKNGDLDKSFVMNFNPRIIWFAIEGLGIE